MLDALKFVKGAVAKKDFSPELVHYRIKDGRALGYNGKLAISSPIDCQLDVTPKAIPFFRAIEQCNDVIAMNMTAAGKLSVRSGKSKFYVECLENGAYPPITPEGATYPLAPGLYARLALIRPYIAADASRPWAQGVLLRGNTATASNNIVIVQHWDKQVFPVDVNIPEPCVAAMVAVKQDPVSMQVAENAVTFHYEDGRWIRCQLYTPDRGTWPDIDALFARCQTTAQPALDVPEGLWDGLEAIKHHADDLNRVYFRDGMIATSPEDGVGSSYECAVPTGGIFNLDMLASLQSLIAQDRPLKIDFTPAPQACTFFVGMVRGIIVGIRV